MVWQPIVDHSWPAIVALIISWAITHTVVVPRGLQSWRFPLLGYRRGQGSDFFALWPAYFVAAEATLAFGGVIGGVAQLSSTAAAADMLLASFLTITGIGMFRLLCVMLPDQSPNIVIVWVGGAMALGFYLIFAGLTATSLPTLSTNGAISDRALAQAFAQVLVGSLAIAGCVEFLIGGISYLEEHGVLRKII